MATISTHNGSAVRQAHNLRTKACVEKEAHIDPNGVHETWKHESIVQAYHRIFDDAVADYNSRQPRADRQIRNYLANIRKDEKKHDCYEMIIGIYGDDCTTEQGYQIMREFTDGWQERNPNLELIGAYYHADEEGKPHVHLDYIPVAHGYKNGMHTQNGLVKALGEMGFQKIGKATAQIRWEARENAHLDKLCQKYGIKVEHPRAQGVQHLHTEVYKATQEANKARQEAAAARQEAAAAIRVRDTETEFIELSDALKAAMERAEQEPAEIEIIDQSAARPPRRFPKREAQPASITISSEAFQELLTIREDVALLRDRAPEFLRLIQVAKNYLLEDIRKKHIDVAAEAEKLATSTADRLRKKVAALEVELQKMRDTATRLTRENWQTSDELQDTKAELETTKTQLEAYTAIAEHNPAQWQQLVNQFARDHRQDPLDLQDLDEASLD